MMFMGEFEATVDVRAMRAMEQRSGGSSERQRLRPVRRKTREEVKRGLADPSWVHQEQEAGHGRAVDTKSRNPMICEKSNAIKGYLSASHCDSDRFQLDAFGCLWMLVVVDDF